MAMWLTWVHFSGIPHCLQAYQELFLSNRTRNNPWMLPGVVQIFPKMQCWKRTARNNFDSFHSWFLIICNGYQFELVFHQKSFTVAKICMTAPYPHFRFAILFLKLGSEIPQKVYIWNTYETLGSTLNS